MKQKLLSNITVYIMVFTCIILFSAVSVIAESAVNLRTAGDFTILTKAGITNTEAHASHIIGDIGASPITAASMDNVFCSEITGTIYGANNAYTGSGDASCFAGSAEDNTLVETAVGHMETAYDDAAGRDAGVGSHLNRGDGTLTDLTLTPGVYTWGTAVTIPTDLTLDCEGNFSAVFIFQIAQTLDIASDRQVILTGDCLNSNIFWQVAGATTLGTNSVFEGTILDATNVAILTGATLNGRALAQTAVTLQSNAVTLSPMLTTITLTPAIVNLTLDDTQQLTAVKHDQYGDNILALITYASNDTDVATVNNNGLVTAINSGSARITASNGEISDSSIINVDARVLTTIILTPAIVNLTAGETQQLTTVKHDQYGDNIVAVITYVSNDTNIATVNASGFVTTIVAGTARITASNGAISDASIINVRAAPILTTITLTPQVADLPLGSTLMLTTESYDQYGQVIDVIIAYESGNTNVATVNETNGLITSVNVGTTTITASSGAIHNTSTITVVAMPVLTTIILTPATANITIGLTTQLTVAKLDQYNQPIVADINYTSNDTNIATVNASGFVTTINLGTARITASNGAISDTSTITVREIPVLTSIVLTPATANIITGQDRQLTATGLDQFDNAIDAVITYTSSNESIATVNASGFVTTIVAGTAIINASNGAISDTSIITVRPTFQQPETNPTTPALNLGTANNFVLLSKTGISTTGVTAITGNIGVSPIDSTAITGFGLTMDVSNQFSTSALVTGKIYAADYTAPTPSDMTTAISDMQTAYTDLAGIAPDVTELGSGNIGGMTLAPGVYKWSTGVTIPTDVTLNGSSTDVWIFQIAQTLDIASDTEIILIGGAQAKNIFWQVAGQTTLGTTSVFNGNILDQTAIVIQTGATLNGRALAQTQVTVDASTVNVVATSDAAFFSDWKSADYNITLHATGFNNTEIAYINYTLNNISGQIIGDSGNILINISGNNTLVYYAVDINGNAETPTTIYALLDKANPVITAFTLSDTNVNVGDSIIGTCTATDDNVNTLPSTIITGINTGDAGTRTAICTATDASGKVVTTSIEYTVIKQRVSHGSSSGGSSSAIIDNGEISQIVIFSELIAGVRNIGFEKEGVALTNIELKTISDATDVKFVVTQLTGKPSGIPEPQLDKIYAYLQIDHTNLDNSMIGFAKIQFKVDKAWVARNSVDTNQINLYRYTSDWDLLDTTMISQDEIYYYFEAYSPGLSYFVIGTPFVADIAPVVVPVVVPNQNPVTPPQFNVPDDTGVTPANGNLITGQVTGDQNSGTGNFPWVWIIGGMLLLLLIAIILSITLLSSSQKSKNDIRAARPNPFGDIHPVMAIEGVGPEHNKELHAIGIKNTKQLWNADPIMVARETGSSQSVVKGWQNMAELISVNDIGPQYAELLERSGVHSIDQLKNYDPHALLKLITKKQDSLKINIQGNSLGYSIVDHWITEARNHRFTAPEKQTA